MSGLHSPGPWWFGLIAWDNDAEEYRPCVKPAEFHANGYGGQPSIYDANGHEVVGCDEYDVFGDWDAPEGSREANIRLLLAAPELLAVAQAVVDAYQSEDGPNWKPIARMAHEAVAKATGAAP